MDYNTSFYYAVLCKRSGKIDRQYFIKAWSEMQYRRGIKPKVLNESGTAWVEAV